MKKYIFSICLIVMLAVTTIVAYNLINKEENNVNLAENDIILSISNEADLTVDYSNIDNLVKDSDIVAIAKIETLQGSNYNPNRNRYVPIYTTGTLKIEKIVLNKSDVSVNSNDVLNYVRLGGKIEYAEYLKGLSDSEKTKLERNMFTKTKLTTEQIGKKLVKDYYYDDVELENNKEYLVFLKFSNDYQKYNIVGFEYGLREYDSNTMQIKNNETNEFESLNKVTEKIQKEEM